MPCVTTITVARAQATGSRRRPCSRFVQGAPVMPLFVPEVALLAFGLVDVAVAAEVRELQPGAQPPLVP